jgi:hypothetical protein
VSIGPRLRTGLPRNRGSILDNGKILNLSPKISRSAQEVASMGNECALPRGKTAWLWISLLGCHRVPGLSTSGAKLPHYRGPVSWCEEG